MTLDDEFRVLFRAEYRRVQRFVERRVDDQGTAEEITAEVFAIAWKKRDTTEITLAWLFKTAKHRIGDHYRRTRRRHSAESALQRLAEEPPEHLATLDALAVAEALQQLAPRERDAVLLTYWEGLGASEVAEVLGGSTGAIWITLSRARAKLRQQLTLSSDAMMEEGVGHVGDR